MSRGLFDISNYAKLYHCACEIRHVSNTLEMCKFNTSFVDDPELENLRLNAEFAVKAYYNKLDALADDTGDRITGQYLKGRSLF